MYGEGELTYRQPIQVADSRVEDTSMDPRRRVLASPVPKRFDTTTLDGSRLEQVQTLLNDVKFHEAMVAMLGVGD